MTRLFLSALAAAALTAAASANPVPVPGSSVKYARTTTVQVGDRPVSLKLTGVGMRTKAIFNVYAVGSYVQEGVSVRTPEELAKADATRMLHLVMERTVESADFIDALKSAVAKTYPADKFAAEFSQVAAAVGNRPARKGDHVKMTAVPGAGVRIQVADAVDVKVTNKAFAQALWEIYLGPKPIDEGLKKNLVAQSAR
jgi:hypothetical protein